MTGPTGMNYRTWDVRWSDRYYGSDLPAALIDQNFYTLEQLILNGGYQTPVGITGFNVAGAQFYVELTNGVLLGPNDLPTAVWTWRDDWTPLTSYAVNDTFYEPSTGAIYVVIYDHTSDTVFDPNENDGGGNYYYQKMLEMPSNVLPTGGTAGYALVKNSAVDYDVTWELIRGVPSGSTGQFLQSLGSGGSTYSSLPGTTAYAYPNVVGSSGNSGATGTYAINAQNANVEKISVAGDLTISATGIDARQLTLILKATAPTGATGYVATFGTGFTGSSGSQNMGVTAGKWWSLLFQGDPTAGVYWELSRIGPNS